MNGGETLTSLPLANILVGAGLLFLGRRLFWVFVAGTGFIAGAVLAGEWLGPQPAAISLVIGLAAGLIGAVLSVFLQRAAVAVAGFVSGGYLLYTLALDSGHPSLAWAGFLIGGILGAVFVVVTFDWALIGLSALTGASLIAGTTRLESSASTLLFFALLIVGVIAQASQLTRVTEPKGK